MNPSSLLMAIVNKLSLSLILVYWTKDKFRCVHVVHIDTETFRHFLFPPSFHSPYFPSLFLFFFLKSQNCLRVQISYLALPIWDIWFGKKKNDKFTNISKDYGQTQNWQTLILILLGISFRWLRHCC